MRRAVFLDRDGVLNRAILRQGKPYPPQNEQELLILPGVASACRTLKAADYFLLGVTNQPDVARRTQTRHQVEAINTLVQQETGIDAIYVCYHQESDRCSCRKPKPGLLLQGARDWGIELAVSFMVGDRSKDIEAGRRAGCRTILIQSGHREIVTTAPDYRADALRSALPILLQPL